MKVAHEGSHEANSLFLLQSHTKPNHFIADSQSLTNVVILHPHVSHQQTQHERRSKICYARGIEEFENGGEGRPSRKEEVVTREYTINLHRRLHGW
ncbi:hypothetical protein QL285_075951 [Trifolium repens]|nr:hypothetical protein QL285_075951 [Trifolium repens]